MASGCLKSTSFAGILVAPLGSKAEKTKKRQRLHARNRARYSEAGKVTFSIARSTAAVAAAPADGAVQLKEVSAMPPGEMGRRGAVLEGGTLLSAKARTLRSLSLIGQPILLLLLSHANHCSSS